MSWFWDNASVRQTGHTLPPSEAETLLRRHNLCLTRLCWKPASTSLDLIAFLLQHDIHSRSQVVDSFPVHGLTVHGFVAMHDLIL